MDRSSQGAGAVRIVRGVDQHRGVQAHRVQPTRTIRRRESLAHDVDIERLIAGSEEGLDSCEGETRVRRLMLAEERHKDLVVVAAKPPHRDQLSTDRNVASQQPEVLRLDLQRHIEFTRPGHDDRSRVVGLARGDGGAPGSDDAGLLAGYLLDRVAEILGVIHADRGDDRDRGGGHGCRIPGAAHADFDDRDIDGGVGESRVGQRRDHFEVGQGNTACVGGVLVH